jgi:hypothetical protein
MFRRLSLLIALGFSALSACGCTVIDNSLSPRVSTLNFGIDHATNDAILTNIIRASRSQPLTFVAISKVSGSQTASLSNGLPTFTIGPDLTAQQKQFTFANNSINQNASGNFDVAPLAGRDFTKGLLLPLSMTEIELLLSQGLPRELLFNLVVESFEFTWCDKDKIRKAKTPSGHTCDGNPVVNRNDLNGKPTDDFNFGGIVKKLTDTGLNIEHREETNPSFRHGDKPDQIPPTVVKSRFCFDADSDAKVLKFRRPWLCGTDWLYFKNPSSKGPGNTARKGPGPTPGEPPTIFFDDVIDYEGGPRPVSVSHIRVQPRSIYGIFRYLGQILAAQKAADLTFPLRNRAADAPRYPLLQIVTGPALSCFASVQFEAQSYCVPEDGSPATKLVFSILAQLIALKTQPGDLPFTPTVRIAP